MKKKSGILLLTIFAGLMITSNLFAFQDFHHGQAAEKINIDSLFDAAQPLSKSPEGHELIQMCIKTYGGRQQLEKLKSLQLEYKMMPKFGKDSLDIVKYWASDRKYKIYRSGPNTTECRILNGNQSWFQNLDTTIELNDGRYKAEMFSYLTLSMPLAAMTERFDDMRYGVRNNDSLAYIYFKKNDSLVMAIGIHPHTLMIVSSEGYIYQKEERFSFKNYFSDFKLVEGFIIPHYMVNISMGLEVANSVLKSVKINTIIPSSEFEPSELSAGFKKM